MRCGTLPVYNCRSDSPAALTPRLGALLIAASMLLCGCAGGETTRSSGRADSGGPAWIQGRMNEAEALELSRRISLASMSLRSFGGLAPAVAQSLEHARSKPPSAPAMNRPWLRLTWGQVALTLEHLMAVLPLLDQDPEVLGREFAWFRGDPRTLLTGYYEPWLRATLTPDPAHPYPLYAPPADRDAYDREAIDFGGALAGRGLEIAWVDSLVDAYFLHVQGSGRLAFPDGGAMHVLYAGTNGRPYVGLGRIMAEEGCFPEEEMSMQSIRAYLEAHPERMREYMSRNPHYIFFRLSPDGPFGSTGAVLTPRVSAAVDPEYLPYATLMVLDGLLPTMDGSRERHTGLALAQDTGVMDGNHVDLFCGSDERAAFQAGLMKDRAGLYVLVSKHALQ